jgi:pimeloyl-ACP methyl ester carboxylesterase
MVQVIKLRRATAGMIRGNGHGPSVDSGQIPGVFIDWRTAVNRETDSMVHERAMVRELITNSSYRPELTFTDAELAAIEQPTLMLYGTDDAVGSRSVWTRVMNTMPGGRLIVIDGAGHMLWLDQPMRVAAELRAFLGED